MIFFAYIVVATLSICLAFGWLIYALEVVTGLVPSGPEVDPPIDASVVILIPAHNESAGIGHAIAKLKKVSEGARILVVADNCEDDTARIAALAGASVVERADLSRIGKGYALDFGRSELFRDPPSVVIVLDADCELAPGSVGMLAGVAARGFPAQAVNTLKPDRSAHPLVQISSFAFLIKNKVRALGLARTSGATVLTGTGMAFPWAVFSQAPLATDNIVEDLALGIQLTRQGCRPQIAGAAQVLSSASDVTQSRVQRTRWEHGFMSTIVAQGFPLFIEALRTRSRPLLGLSLHLLVPPLALLISLTLVVLVAGFVLYNLYYGWNIPIILSAIMVFGLSTTLVAWIVHGRDTLSLGALLRIPIYVIWKIPLYARFLFAREKSWRRTPRADEAK